MWQEWLPGSTCGLGAAHTGRNPHGGPLPPGAGQATGWVCLQSLGSTASGHCPPAPSSRVDMHVNKTVLGSETCTPWDSHKSAFHLTFPHLHDRKSQPAPSTQGAQATAAEWWHFMGPVRDLYWTLFKARCSYIIL